MPMGWNASLDRHILKPILLQPDSNRQGLWQKHQPVSTVRLHCLQSAVLAKADLSDKSCRDIRYGVDMQAGYLR